MCGVYGFFGKPTTKTIRALENLGLLNEARGQDSAGLAVATGDGYMFYKNDKKSSLFLEEKKTRQMLQSLKGKPFVNVIGHTRAATRGSVTSKNAHPFRIGRFLFAHNGVIGNFDDLQKKYKTEYQVDSQIIGYLLNIHEDPLEVFEEILGGWFTVPYMDIEDQYGLKIAKSGAPLSLAVLADGSGVFYSSTKSDLKLALKDAGISAGVGETLGDKLYSFEWDNGLVKRDKIKFDNRVSIYQTRASTPTWVGHYNQDNKTEESIYNHEDDTGYFPGQDESYYKSVLSRTQSTVNDAPVVTGQLLLPEKQEKTDEELLADIIGYPKVNIPKRAGEIVNEAYVESLIRTKNPALVTPENIELLKSLQGSKLGRASGSQILRMSDEETAEWLERLKTKGKLKKRYLNG